MYICSKENLTTSVATLVIVCFQSLSLSPFHISGPSESPNASPSGSQSQSPSQSPSTSMLSPLCIVVLVKAMKHGFKTAHTNDDYKITLAWQWCCFVSVHPINRIHFNNPKHSVFHLHFFKHMQFDHINSFMANVIH